MAGSVTGRARGAREPSGGSREEPGQGAGRSRSRLGARPPAKCQSRASFKSCLRGSLPTLASGDGEPASVFWWRAEQRTASPLSWRSHGDLITVLLSGYLLRVPSDRVTLDFLAAWGSMCPVRWAMPVPEPSHGICARLKNQSGFPWKVHVPTEYLKCGPLPPPTLNASSSELLYFTINPKVSIRFMFALKMPYRPRLTAGSGGKPSSP